MYPNQVLYVDLMKNLMLMLENNLDHLYEEMYLMVVYVDNDDDDDDDI